MFDYWECWKEGGKYKNTESRNRMLAKLKELTGSDFELAKKVICDAIDHSWQGFCKGNQLFYKDETFEPPTFDEVKAYAWDRYRDDLAEKFFNYYAASDWRDGRGYPVKNWKLKFAEWETRNPDPDDSGYVPGAIDKIFS